MKHRNYTIIAAAIGMMALILDARTALEAANAGMQLCIQTLIPSLLPFFIFSILLTGALSGQDVKIFRPLEKLCRIPRGSGSLLVIGLLGGYPVGAQNISLAHQRGELSRTDARRMIGFCSNAGPAFLFGMIGQFFEEPLYTWLLWIVHILSALAVSLLIPGIAGRYRSGGTSRTMTLSQALEKSVRVMVTVCGWVVFFRLIIGFADRWILWILPASLQVFLKGILELSNGCVLLAQIPCIGERFLLASVMLAFGGFCVTMQTRSVCGELSAGTYLPGKLLQSCISLYLAAVLQITFPLEQRYFVPTPLMIVSLILLIFLTIRVRFDKNRSSIPAVFGV